MDKHRRDTAGGRRHAVCVLCLLPFALSLVSCGPKIDLKQALEVTDVSTGWFDAGVVEGRNKLVPSVTFRLHKTTNADLRPLAVNLAFKKLNGQNEEEQDEVYLQKVDFAEGAQTAPITIRPEHGYTADPPQTRAEMLQNSQFQDFRAIIFAKYGSAQWVQLARVDIKRQLLLK